MNDDDLAIDVGCGTGQSTVLLAPHFQHIIGMTRQRTIESVSSAVYRLEVMISVSSRSKKPTK